MIACGPLQAIYIMAAGTGSMIEGAKVLFIFALGTLPVMLGFGFVTSFISGKLTQKILKASGIIVIILGLFMLNTGLMLTGSGFDVNTFTAILVPAQSDNIAVQKGGYQEIHMVVENNDWTPNKFVLEKGVPVHWIIDSKEGLSCNEGIQVPKYDLKFQIKPGEQEIDFTPADSGVVPWSCWMGMVPGTFVVVDDINKVDASAIRDIAHNANPMDINHA